MTALHGLLQQPLDGVNTDIDDIKATIDAALIVQNDLLARVASGEVKQAQIELSLEELSITKGSVSRYQIKGTSFGVASRNGELYVNSSDPELVTTMSFAPFDLNGAPIKPALTGDIVELVEAAGTLNTGEVSRFRITSGGDTQALVVEYLGGNNVFDIDEILEVYIYPQNEETASKEYVDSQDALKVNLSGENEITAPWQIKTENKTYITAGSDELRLYHLADPTDRDDGWAANKGYVDGKTAGLASEEYVDDAISAIPDTDLSGYLTKEGQQDLDSDVWKVRQPNSEGAFRSFINIHDGEMNLYNVVTPTGSSNEKWAANKEYADKKVAKTGGTMTGDLNLDGADRAINIENGNRFRLKAKDADGDGRTFVDIQTTDHDGPEAQDAGYRIRIYHLADPTSAYHAANMKYVDDAIASIDTNINLDNYLPLVGGDLTGRVDITLSDPALAAIRTIGSINVKADGQQIGGSNSFIAHKDYVRVYATPVNVADVVNREWSLHNGMRWTHVDDADAGNLSAGEFFVASNGNIYMHGVSKDGIDIAPGNTATEEAEMKLFCSVHRSNGDSAYFITANKVAFNQGSNKYIRIEKLHVHLGDSTSQGQIYRLNIPGFTY